MTDTTRAQWRAEAEAAGAEFVAAALTMALRLFLTFPDGKHPPARQIVAGLRRAAAQIERAGFAPGKPQ